MGPRRTRTAPTLLLLFAACAVSSSAAPRIEAGQRTRVLLTDTRSGRTLVLQNLSSGSRNEVYRDSNGDAMVKVIDDRELQQLLDVLAMKGMFDLAGPAPAPGARVLLAVEQAGRAFVWSRPPASTETLDQVRAFDEGRGYVMTVYNAAIAHHASDLRDSDSAQMRELVEKDRARRGQGGQ
jgi:hypothetical protein